MPFSVSDRILAPPRTRPITIGFLVLVTAIIIALWIVIEMVMLREREDATDAAIKVNANLARVVEEHALRTLDLADGVLQMLKARFEAEGANFDLMDFYKTIPVNSDIFRNAIITDETGLVILGSRSFPRVSLADHPHIGAHLSRDTGKMSIDVPREARVDGQWSFVVSRRANKPDGSLLGIVALSVDPLYFSNFYKDLQLGRDANVALIGLDGVLRARINDAGRGVPANVAGGEIFRQFDRASHGSYTAPSVLDGISRVFAYRPVRDFPLIVLVGTGTDDVLARPNERARIYRLTGWLTSIFLLVFATGLVMVGEREMAGRERVLASLRESEARFRSTFEAAGHGMALLDLDARIIEVNAAFCRITGYKEAELVGRRIQDITHLDDVAEGVEHREMLITGEISSVQAEKRYVHKEGTTVWVQLNTGIVLNEAGKPLHFVSQVQDVTGQKKAEARLQQAQKMEAVGQLTAGIAHDFNNILAAVVGNLDIIGERMTTDPVTAARHAEEAIDAALSGAELVKRLLAFSRQQPLRPRPTDIKELIIGVVPLLRPSLGERIEIRTMIPDDLWPALADTAQVESALLNLALNARDAMSDGGTLSLDAANVHVNGGRFRADEFLKAGDYVVIAVTDSGTGMAPEILARVFEPFFTTKGVGAGSGLGLSMVLGTMQQLGGAVRIYSEPGHGTTIRLFLPRVAEGENTAPVQGPAPAQPTGTERILLVEDNGAIRRELEVTIRSLGYTVMVAQDADDALAMWDAGHRFDLVFTDIIMPGRYNGVDLAHALRARDPRMKVLLSSGFANPATVMGDIADQGFELLQKPYRKAVLAARLRAVLDQRAT